ncbi:MAG: hypothetical protein WCW25_01035 [Patescibacteria group bacterium]|jgi:hypothetical protein
MTTILTPEQENEPVTKGFLKQELDQRFESFTDKMFKTFATKDDLKDFARKDDLILWKDEIVKSNEEVIGELKKIRENFAMNQAAHDRFEERIGVLEEKTGISPVSV